MECMYAVSTNILNFLGRLKEGHFFLDPRDFNMHPNDQFIFKEI